MTYTNVNMYVNVTANENINTLRNRQLQNNNVKRNYINILLLITLVFFTFSFWYVNKSQCGDNTLSFYCGVKALDILAELNIIAYDPAELDTKKLNSSNCGELELIYLAYDDTIAVNDVVECDAAEFNTLKDGISLHQVAYDTDSKQTGLDLSDINYGSVCRQESNSLNRGTLNLDDCADENQLTDGISLNNLAYDIIKRCGSLCIQEFNNTYDTIEFKQIELGLAYVMVKITHQMI